MKLGVRGKLEKHESWKIDVRDEGLGPNFCEKTKTKGKGSCIKVLQGATKSIFITIFEIAQCHCEFLTPFSVTLESQAH